MSNELANLAISDSGFAFNPNDGSSYSLNQMAILIIKYLKEHQDIGSIATKISQEYDIEYNEAYVDVLDFSKKLEYYGLL